MVRQENFQFQTFLSYIRALFPRWNFFDQIAYHFELSFQTPGSSRWERLPLTQERKIFSLFWNPFGNLTLAQANILEHFARDLQELQSIQPQLTLTDLERLTTYQLMLSLVEIKLISDFQNIQTFQFRLSAHNPQEVIDLFISDWMILEKS